MGGFGNSQFEELGEESGDVIEEFFSTEIAKPETRNSKENAQSHLQAIRRELSGGGSGTDLSSHRSVPG